MPSMIEPSMMVLSMINGTVLGVNLASQEAECLFTSNTKKTKSEFDITSSLFLFFFLVGHGQLVDIF